MYASADKEWASHVGFIAKELPQQLFVIGNHFGIRMFIMSVSTVRRFWTRPIARVLIKIVRCGGMKTEYDTTLSDPNS